MFRCIRGHQEKAAQTVLSRDAKQEERRSLTAKQ